MALYAFDGTWKDADKQPENEHTSIHRFRCLYSTAGTEQIFYWPGPGSRFGRFGSYFGGLFGIGAKWRVTQALGRVHEQFSSGDEIIDIIGFSRGAAAAVSFAWMLHEQGVREPEKIRLFGIDVTTFMQSRIVMERPRIRFIGLFDTVFSTSDLSATVPLSQRFSLQQYRPRLIKDFELPANVNAAYHAMAIHERTPMFDVTRIRNAHEIWFPGVHGDIGGGGQNGRVSTTALQWMVAKAKSHGLAVDADNTLADFEPLVPEPAKKETSLLREIRETDTIHECAAGLPLGVDVDSLTIEKTDVAQFGS